MCQLGRPDDGGPRPGHQGHDIGIGDAGRGGLHRRHLDPQAGVPNTLGKPLASLGVATEHADLRNRAHGANGGDLRQRLFACTDLTEHGGIGPRHPARGHARNGGGAHLPERKGLDHSAQPPGLRVPDQQQRRRTARRMRPGLGAHDLLALDRGADGMQRVTVAPENLGLFHVHGAALCLQRQPVLQSVDRIRQTDRLHHIGLADPEREVLGAHPVNPSSKMEGTGGSSASVLTIKACTR